MRGRPTLRFVRVALEVARKDIRLELRSKRAVPMAAALALLVVVVFGFAFDGRPQSGSIWVAFVFAGTLSVMQSVGVEGENSALDGMLLAPVPYAAIYAGKVLSATLFVGGVGVFTLLAARVFLGLVPVPALPWVLLTIGLFSFGFAAVSVLVAAIAVYTRITDLLVPVLLVPVVVPGLIAGIRLLDGAGSNWFTVLAGYDGVVFVTGLLLFEELVT
jgi:heme exporter protein B